MNKTDTTQIRTVHRPPLALESVRVAATLNGILLDVTTEQQFINPTAKNSEILYQFPLPWGAVLLNVTATLGGKTLQGVVAEKNAAADHYEQALAEGDMAILLEKTHAGDYCLNLGNLNPGERCKITLHYAQLLQFETNSLRLTIPTLIAPLYGNPIQDGGLQPHHISQHSFFVNYPFDVEVKISGGLSQAGIHSPSHAIRIEKEPALTRVTLTHAAALDRDFVLVLDQLTQPAYALAGPDAANEDRHILMACFDTSQANLQELPAAVKILVDCSGSMSGDSISAAARALQCFTEQLRPGDYFSLSRFGSTVVHRSRALWRYTPATQRAAKQWVNKLDADLGGTEMESALTSTFALPHSSTADILLITDGEIYAVDAVIRAAQTAAHRVFVVGMASLNTISKCDETLSRITANARIKGLRDKENHTATQLALDYQLVSEHTHFILVHQRAETEKATEMPELLAVPQMIPAGWGGVGSVKGVCAPFNSMADLSYLDRPAFLRRSGDSEMQDERHSRLSPIELVRFLLKYSFETWPTSFEELSELGIPQEIVDWLMFEVDEGYEEKTLVRAFLSALLKISTTRIDLVSAMLKIKLAIRNSQLSALMGETQEAGGVGEENELMDKIEKGLRGLGGRKWEACEAFRGRGVMPACTGYQ